MAHDEEIAAAVGGVLRWYAAMGVDEIAGDDAVDWLARSNLAPGGDYLARLAGQRTGDGSAGSPQVVRRAEPRSPTVTAQPATPPSGSSSGRGPGAGSGAWPGGGLGGGSGTKPASVSVEAAMLSARELAAGASNLAELQELLAGFDGCGLKATAKNLCFYRGAETAPVMIIGEAPGRDEDLAGRPFVGRAGQLLDKMLAAAGFGEEQVHITNIVYWRPPGNRTPSPQEAQICRPFLDRQVALVQPRLVLLLGAAAAKSAFDTAEGIMKVRGKWRETGFGEIGIRTLATLHPAFLLRSPAYKRLAWRDLLTVRGELEQLTR